MDKEIIIFLKPFYNNSLVAGGEPGGGGGGGDFKRVGFNQANRFGLEIKPVA